MSTRYTVVSHEAHTDENSGCACAKAARTYKVEKMTLVRDAYKLPIVEAKREVFTRKVSEIIESRRDLKSLVRFISVQVDEDTKWNELLVTAEGLAATCPHCKREEKLKHEQWRAYVSRQSGCERVVCQKRKPEQGDSIFADYPDEWILFEDDFLESLVLRSDNIERPYGNSNPVIHLYADTQQPKLPLYGSNDPTLRETYGQTGGYKGIYECQYCGCAYYVYYNSPDRERYVSEPGSTGGVLSTALRELGPDRLQATISVTGNRVEVLFSPAAENRVRSIRFDTKCGYTEVDGFQLMKRDVYLPADLSALPFGFTCSQLVLRIGQLIDEQVGGTLNAAMIIAQSRQSKFQGSMFGTELNFVDLAFANRLRGYPNCLYENIFHDCGKRSTAIAPFDSLPIHYNDVEKALKMSGLPQCKSIRRKAFQQPLLISYAFSLDKIPFEDPNLLNSVFSHDSALYVLETFRNSHRGGHSTIFDYLKDTWGEKETWCYLKRLLENHSWLGFLASNIEQGFFTNDIKVFVNSLKIDKAARILSNIMETNNGLERSIREKYRYTQDELQLEATINGYSIKLPQIPFDLLVASADLKNCLSSYVNCIGEKLVVLTIFHAGKLQGAIEVDMSEHQVVQAKGRCNAHISKQSALGAAITMWMHEKKLECSKW